MIYRKNRSSRKRSKVTTEENDCIMLAKTGSVDSCADLEEAEDKLALQQETWIGIEVPRYGDTWC